MLTIISTISPDYPHLKLFHPLCVALPDVFLSGSSSLGCKDTLAHKNVEPFGAAKASERKRNGEKAKGLR